MKRIVLAALLSLAGLAVGADRLAADITVTTLHSFANTDGANPIGGLLDGGDGHLYGTTSAHGSDPDVTNPAGTVFRITPGGGFESLYTFEFQVTGDAPYAGVLRLGDGTLLGTTRGSGAYDGSVFQLAANGDFTDLHTFTGYFFGGDGGHPDGAPVAGGDGSFYGTSYDGGAFNIGTLYRIDAGGDYTLVHSFGGELAPDADGFYPHGGLVLGDDGSLYGTTSGEGPSGSHGTVFRFTPGDPGVVTTIHQFTGSDGSDPNSTLVKGPDGQLYGTTSGGGEHSAGTVFRIAENGDFLSLHSFDFSDLANGASPVGVTFGSDGNLYGAAGGGTSDVGTLFRVQPNGGGFRMLLAFSSLNDGPFAPRSGPIESGGNFYGTTFFGGANGPGCGCGTVYEIDGAELMAPEPGSASCGVAAVLAVALAAAARAPRRDRSR